MVLVVRWQWQCVKWYKATKAAIYAKIRERMENVIRKQLEAEQMKWNH